MHSFHECKDGSIHLLTCNGLNSAILDIESKEFVCHYISLNVNLIKILRLTNILYSLVVVASPEEGDIAEGYHLSKHIKSGIGALIHRSHIMLYSHSSASSPVGVRCGITSCVNVFNRSLEEGVANNSSHLIKFNT